PDRHLREQPPRAARDRLEGTADPALRPPHPRDRIVPPRVALVRLELGLRLRADEERPRVRPGPSERPPHGAPTAESRRAARRRLRARAGPYALRDDPRGAGHLRPAEREPPHAIAGRSRAHLRPR